MRRTLREMGRRARRVARTLRHLPDRMLHAHRRSSNMRRLKEKPSTSVLIMCLGNICRSPFAAAVLQRAANGSSVRVESAGFLRSGRPAPDPARQSALRRGIDMSSHRSRQVTPEMVEGADLVIVMDRGQRRQLAQQFGRRDGVLVLGDLDPRPIDTRTIRDPFDQADEVFDQVYDRIERCVAVLAPLLRR